MKIYFSWQNDWKHMKDKEYDIDWIRLEVNTDDRTFDKYFVLFGLGFNVWGTWK